MKPTHKKVIQTKENNKTQKIVEHIIQTNEYTIAKVDCHKGININVSLLVSRS